MISNYDADCDRDSDPDPEGSRLERTQCIGSPEQQSLSGSHGTQIFPALP